MRALSEEYVTEPKHLLRAGSGSPLVLFHGITCSGRVWRSVLPYLVEHHEVIMPTALGHHGGETPRTFPVRIRDVVDDAERTLDRLGLDQAHLAGNSMGGWVALELARRGRARTVCALSPAGAWEDVAETRKRLKLLVELTRRTRGVIPWLALSSGFRRRALRDNAVHGERLSREQFMVFIEDLLACSAADDLLATGERLDELRAPCPITVAWSEQDRIFPLHRHLPIARACVPGAEFRVLPNVGHVPMIDDPALVARTLIEAAGALSRAA
ncbi:MAG: alpha/beta hydrolase [Myxococcales bacterium]